MKSHILGAVCVSIFSFLLSTNSQVHASVIYDEGVSGDLPNSFNIYLPLGSLASPGTSSVVGSLHPHDHDNFSFVIDPGFELSAIILADWQTTFTANFFNMSLDGATSNPGNPSNIGVNILNTFLGGPVGAGTHTFRLWTASGVISNYQLDFVTSAVVPVPAGVWLFGSGLIGLIGIARRKTA